MDSDLEPILKLVAKIEQGLPEIQMRSITTLHTKISVGLLDVKRLPQIVKLPGVLMYWINQNNSKSQFLYKALIIIAAYTKSEQGLQLLREYEGLEYFEELRKHLLANQRNIQEFIDVIERIIKALLPLGRTEPTQENCQENSAQTELKESQTSEDHVEADKKRKIDKHQTKNSIELNFKTVRQSLSKKQDDALYSLLIELKHGKKEFHFHILRQIKEILKYCSSKSFRYKSDLVFELQSCIQCSIFPYLCCEIIALVLDGIMGGEQKLQHFQQKIVNIDKGEILRAQQQKVSIQINKTLFDNIFAYEIYNKICNFYVWKVHKGSKESEKILNWLAHCQYRFAFRNFISLVKLLKISQINRKILVSTIQFYAINFKQSRQQLFELVCQEEELISIKDFPCLNSFLEQNQNQLSFKHIYRYIQSQSFDINHQLERLPQIVSNLSKGINGLAYGNNIHHNLSVYLNTLMILTISVTRQDPLMSYYPNIKETIIKISQHQNESICLALYEEILLHSNSFDKINYLSKSYIKSEVILLALGDDEFYLQLLEHSLEKERLLQNMLQISKKMVLTQPNQFKSINSLQTILFALTFSKNSKLSSLSQFLLNKINRKHKIKSILLQLFSSNQETRVNISKELLNQEEDVLESIILKKQKQIRPKKKLLKVTEQTITHFMAVLFDQSLEIDVKLSGGRQLLETIERAEITKSVFLKILELRQQLHQILVTSVQIQGTLAPIFISLYTLITKRLESEYPNQVEQGKHIPCEVLLNLLIEIKDLQAKDHLLELIYTECMQSPFTKCREMHFIMMYYPQIQVSSMKVSKVSSVSHKNSQIHQKVGNDIKPDIILKDYRKTNLYLHYVEFLWLQTINDRKIDLNNEFVELVQKQIGGALHGSKGDDALCLLCTSFDYLIRHAYKIPSELAQITPSLLNSLMIKQTSDTTKEDITRLVSYIGCKRSKQVISIITSPNETEKSTNCFKYMLALQLIAIQPEIIEILLKNLSNSLHLKDTIKIIQVFIKNGSSLQHLSEYSRMLIINAILKCIKNQDQFTKKVGLMGLIEVLNKIQNSTILSEQASTIICSLVGFAIEGNHKISFLCLLFDSIRILLSLNPTIDEIKIVKNLIRKLLACIKTPKQHKKESDSSLFQSSIFGLLNSLILQQYGPLIQELDLIDTAINLVEIISGHFQFKNRKHLLLFSQVAQFISNSALIQRDLPKYVLLSSKLLYHVILIVKHFSHDLKEFGDAHRKFIVSFIESIGYLINTLAIEEDLFISKLNQIFTTQDEFYKENIFLLLSKFIDLAGKQFLKSFAWIAIIWWKGRNVLDEFQIGKNVAKRFLQIKEVYLMKGFLAISTEAKLVVLSSQKLVEIIKFSLTIIQNKIVKEIKEGSKLKKKANFSNRNVSQQSVDYQNESAFGQIISQEYSKQVEQIEDAMTFFTSLFYSSGSQSRPNQFAVANKEVVKKILSLIEKFYIFIEYHPSLNKMFYKILTNLSHSDLLQGYLSSHFSDNNSEMLEETLNLILNSDSSVLTSNVKRAFSLISILIEHESVRSNIFKAKLIQQCNMRLLRIQQTKKNESHLQYINEILNLYICLSLYKDSNLKILTDKKILEALLRLLTNHRSMSLDQKIIKLLANLACYKQNKFIFMANREVHKISLTYLESSSADVPYKGSIISFIYNLVYKNSAAIKLYRRHEVIQLLNDIKCELHEESSINTHAALMEALQSDEIQKNY